MGNVRWAAAVRGGANTTSEEAAVVERTEALTTGNRSVGVSGDGGDGVVNVGAESTIMTSELQTGR